MTDESVSSRPRLMRTIEAGVPRKALRDLKNRVLYGRDAPLSDEPNCATASFSSAI